MSLLSWLGFSTDEERREKIEQKYLAQEEREQAIKDAHEKNEKATPIFQVGTTEDGRVTLRVGQYTNWVTMNDEGVDQLIAMLEAAKGLPAEITEEEEK